MLSVANVREGQDGVVVVPDHRGNQTGGWQSELTKVEGLGGVDGMTPALGFVQTLGPVHLLSKGRRCDVRSTRRANSRRWSSSLSEPFLVPGSVFDFPRIVFTGQGPELMNIMRLERPDLLGLCTWFLALYFGYSEKIRLGVAMQKAMTSGFERLGLGSGTADSLATALHTFPFIFAALLIDSILRGTLGESFAAAGGISLALWAMVFELGRPRELSEEEKKQEMEAWKAFLEFAESRLEKRGRCHYIDINKAFRRQFPRFRDEKILSDQQLKRFVAVWAPQSSRSKRGYYKQLSVKSRPDVF